MSERKGKYDATATVIAGVIIAGLVGVFAWCVGLTPRISLAVSIGAFFIYLYEAE